MKRIAKTLTLLAVLVAFTVPALAQHRGGGRHPAKKRVPIKALKAAVEKLDAMEQQLEGRKKLGPKQVASLRLEIKEARLVVQEFLMDVQDGKTQLPAYECCPCHQGNHGDGKLEVSVNIQGTPEPVMAPVVEEVPLPVAEPMAPQSYKALLGALKEQAFADDKLSVLQTASKDAWFTVEQVKGLLKMFSFPGDKLSALKLVSNALVDPENKFLLYGSFVHSSDKDEAKRILEAN